MECLSTGSIGVDHALGIGGLPRGRIIEIFGPESSGKTTLALSVIAQAQKKGMECAYIDAEHAMDPIYATKLGVDIKKLLISQPSNGEEGMQIVDLLVRGGRTGVIVIDSVAAMTPRAEIEGEVGEVKIGALARLMSQSLRMLTGSIAKSNTIVIFINQLRMTMMTFGGANPETTSGGKALKFYASVRLDIRKIASLKRNEEVIGARSKVKVVKNKVAAPFKQTELDIMYNQGISRGSELLLLGEKYGVVKDYMFEDIKLGRGFDAARENIEGNEELTEKLTEAVMKAMYEK